jgi:hypothetical protein
MWNIIIQNEFKIRRCSQSKARAGLRRVTVARVSTAVLPTSGRGYEAGVLPKVLA